MEGASKIRGFSLLQVVLYLGLLSLLTASVVTVMVNMRKSVVLSYQLARKSEEVSSFLMLKDLLEAAVSNRSLDIEVLSVDGEGRIALAAIDLFSKPINSLVELSGRFAVRGCKGSGKRGFELVCREGSDFAVLFSSCEGDVYFTPYYKLNSSIKPSFTIFQQEGKRLCVHDDFGTHCFERGTSIQLEMFDKNGKPVNFSSEAVYISLKLKPWEAIIACAPEQ